MVAEARGATARTDVEHPRQALIGRGRAGIVYRRPDAHGSLAAKVFIGEPLSDLVNTLLTGAPNPYSWNGNAIRCALYRRRIVAALVRFWFGDRVAVADAVGVDWNASERAWELHTEFVDGYAPALHQPFSTVRDGEQRELVETVMRPLQQRLETAGLDGLVWQAGRGNPVAASNFLVLDRRRWIRSEDPEAPTVTEAELSPRWVWIDLESGVPALFPADPRALFTTYLPASRRHGRLLFDDVDTARLDDYIGARTARIDAALGAGAALRLRRWTADLARHQAAWKSPGRLERGLQCALARQRISPETARRFRRRPLLWCAYEAGRLSKRCAGALLGIARRLAMAVATIRPLAIMRSAARFMTSAARRERVGRLYVLRRIRNWTARRQLGRREAGWLRRATRHHDQATYLSDFAVHIAIKPIYKSIAWLLLPAAAQIGLVPLWLLPVAFVVAGGLSRTLYTATRIGHAVVRRRPVPWTAFWFGMLPIVGVAAYPLQLLAACRGQDGRLAGFLVYDALGALGRRLPIWGGPDTGLEHWANRLGDRIVRERGPLLAVVERQVRK